MTGGGLILKSSAHEKDLDVAAAVKHFSDNNHPGYAIMKIKQFRFDHHLWGNVMGYLLYSNGEGVVIDGMAAQDIASFCESENIRISLVTNTHSHDDHTGGNDFFTKDRGMPFLPTEEAAAAGEIIIGGKRIAVKSLPGHSDDSIVFLCGDILVSGDTIFNGTVGNCYTGDYEAYFRSLQYIMSLPGSTRIYAGHDLVDYAMGVARRIEPRNPCIDGYLKQYNPICVTSTIDLEKKVNPFVRWNDPALDEFRKGLEMPVETPYERWRAMMTVH